MENPDKVKNLLRMSPRTLEREAELLRIEREAIANFEGYIDELESALGMLRSGDYWGWRVLVLIHNKRTIRKYEDILNIKIKDFFNDTGSQTHRSRGYILAKKIGNFWKAVSGDIKIEGRKEITTN
jgi:hypothetical protein